jgi:hypothetical protein
MSSLVVIAPVVLLYRKFRFGPIHLTLPGRSSSFSSSHFQNFFTTIKWSDIIWGLKQLR